VGEKRRGGGGHVAPCSHHCPCCCYCRCYRCQSSFVLTGPPLCSSPFVCCPVHPHLFIPARLCWCYHCWSLFVSTGPHLCSSPSVCCPVCPRSFVLVLPLSVPVHACLRSFAGPRLALICACLCSFMFWATQPLVCVCIKYIVSTYITKTPPL
jgi:hypothetical protein